MVGRRRGERSVRREGIGRAEKRKKKLVGGGAERDEHNLNLGNVSSTLQPRRIAQGWWAWGRPCSTTPSSEGQMGKAER